MGRGLLAGRGRRRSRRDRTAERPANRVGRIAIACSPSIPACRWDSGRSSRSGSSRSRSERGRCRMPPAGGSEGAGCCGIAWRGSARARPQRPLRTCALLVAAAAIALGSAVAVNEARFHSAFSIPLQKQSRHEHRSQPACVRRGLPRRGDRLAIRADDAARRGPPGCDRHVRAFPFIGLPSSPPTVSGRSASTRCSPRSVHSRRCRCSALLLIAGIPGCCAIAAPTRCSECSPQPRPRSFQRWCSARRRRAIWPTCSRACFSGPASGCMCAAACGIACCAQAARAVSGWPPSRSWWRSGLRSTARSGSSSSASSHRRRPRRRAPRSSRAQDDIDRFLGRSPHGVHAGSAFPTTSLGPVGDLFVLGRCDGLYVESFGGTWLPVERTARAGLFELAVAFPATARWRDLRRYSRSAPVRNGSHSARRRHGRVG